MLNGRLAVLAFALTALALRAEAQTLPVSDISPPPIHSAVDSFGVDVLSGTEVSLGKLWSNGAGLSIGTVDSGIDLPATAKPWTDYTGTLMEFVVTSRDASEEWYKHELPAGTYLRVSVGSSSELFRQSGAEYVPVEDATGGLTCSTTTCEYVSKHGTVVLFDKAISNPPNPKAKQVRLTKPDGEVITTTYANWAAPRAISSSLGWMIKYEYPGSASSVWTTKAINTSVDYCDPAASVCNALSNPWPAVATTGTGTQTWNSSHTIQLSSSSTWILTNALNRQYRIDWSYASPTTPISHVYTSPSGVTRNFTLGNCIAETCPQSYKDQSKILSLSIGGNSFSYSRTPIEASALPYNMKNIGPDGQMWAWSARVRPIFYVDQLNRSTRYDYNNVQKYLSAIVDPDATTSGGHTNYSYDSRGNITQISVVPKDGGAPLVTSATYPTTCGNPKTCNKPSSVTTPAGVTTTYTYDGVHGGMLTETRNGIQTRYNYAQQTPYVKNSSGALVASTPVWRLVGISKCMSQQLAACVGTADEVKTIITYGGNNALPTTKTVQSGDGSISLATTTGYDIYGNITSVDGPRPGSHDATYYFYDALRRVTGEIGPDPDGPGPRPRSAIRSAYNADGQVSSIERGVTNGTNLTALNSMTVLNQNTTEYSPSTGLAVVERVYAGGALQKVTQKSYNSERQLECEAQRLNPAVWGSLPSSACTLGSPGSDGNDRITRYTYDATGAQLKTMQAYGTPRQRDYRTRTYDPANGLLVADTDALGNRTVYTYDPFKRPSKTIYPTPGNGAVSSSTDYTQTNYSGALVSSVRLRDGQTISFSYDTFARVSGKSGALSETLGYNNFDQVVSHTNLSTGGPTSLTSNYDFNALGWLRSETRIAGSTSMGSVSYGYDAYGRRTSLSWPDGFYVTYDYVTGGYPADDLQAIKESSGATLASFAYDDYGRRVGLTRGNGVVTSYGYDDLSRLTQLSTDVGGGTSDDIYEAFSYTSAGQLKAHTLNVLNSAYRYTPAAGLTTNYGTNALNQLTSSNGAAISYDARGNLTADALGGSFSYNASNLLTSATQSGVTTTLAYDAENRLHSIAKSGSTTKFIYDGVDLIAETGANNTIVRRYVHGPMVDDPIVWYEGAGTADKRYVTTDVRGSIVGITNSAGSSFAINAYDEYGIPRTGNTGRFQYTGQTWLGEVGLYYYKARLYNPVLGRFMQTDPIGYEDDLNLYAYVGNDPLNKTDPTGTEECSKLPCTPVGNPQRTTQGGVDTGHAKASENLMKEMQEAAVDRGATVDSASYHRDAKAATNGAVDSPKKADVTVNTTEANGAKRTDFGEVERDPKMNAKTQAKLDTMATKATDGRTIRTTLRNFVRGSGRLLGWVGVVITGKEIYDAATNPEEMEEQGPHNCLCD